jgi:hypothetical protein
MSGIRALPLVAGLLGLLALPGSAPAADSCTYDPSTRQVAVVSDGSVSLNVVAGAIYMLPAGPGSCGDATTTNTDSIVVNVPLDSGFLLDGRFAPGATPETRGQSEIEITVHGAQHLGISLGDDLAQHLTYGTKGISVDDDKDVDVRAPDSTSITTTTGAGDDRVSGQGGHGTGAAYPGIVNVRGGDGNDHLIGALGASLLDGGTGNDTLQAIGPASDQLVAGAGDDTLLAADGSRDALNGGPGFDRAHVDEGLDVVHHVEEHF